VRGELPRSADFLVIVIAFRHNLALLLLQDIYEYLVCSFTSLHLCYYQLEISASFSAAKLAVCQVLLSLLVHDRPFEFKTVPSSIPERFR
jgi:hypothetical protein